MTLNTLYSFAELLDGFHKQAAALIAQEEARCAAADTQWQAQSGKLDTAFRQLEQEYQTTEARRKGWAAQYAAQARGWLEELRDPRWQAVKDDCFLQCVSNRQTLSAMSEAELVTYLQGRQEELAKTLHRLKDGFIPPGMSGVVGKVFPGYKRKDYRLLAQQYVDILCAAELLEGCTALDHQRTYTNAAKAQRQQAYDRQKEVQYAASRQQYQADLTSLQAQFATALANCEAQGVFNQDEPLHAGVFFRQNPLPGTPLPPSLANNEGQLCFPVSLPLPQRSCFFLTDADTALYEAFAAYGIDILANNHHSRLYYADLEGLGSHYTSLSPVASWGCAQIWSSEAQIREGLAQLSHRITTHNAAGDSAPQPACFLFVEHLERNIPVQELDTLFRIVKNGPTAGVYVLFSMQKDLVPDRLLAEQLQRMENTLVLPLENHVLPLSGGAGLALCPSAHTELALRWQGIQLHLMQEPFHAAILPLGPRLPAEGCWQQKSSAGGIEITVGDDPTGQPVLLCLNEEKPYVLTIGDVDVGKSSLHHTICIQIMANYSADEVRLAIGDFKMGAEFNVYAASKLLSVEAVVNDEDPDVMASFLRCYVAEMQRRQLLFEQLEERTGQMVRKYETYRTIWEASGRPTETLPRLVLLIDEFQSLFENGTVTAALLSELVRKGRTYGIHIIMASQRAVGDNPRNGFTPALKNYFTSRFVLRVPQTAARTVLSERCADTGRENSGIAAAPCLKKGHAVFNGYMGEMEAENCQVQCYYPDDRTIRLVCQLLTQLYGTGSSVLLKRGAPSPAPMLPPQDCLLLGTSPCLHQDASTIGEDTILDDTLVGIRTAQRGQNLLLTGSDLRMVRSVTQSAALYLLNRCPEEQVHVFGMPTAPLIRELQVTGDPVFVFHTTEEDIQAELTRQAEQPDGCRVNLFVEFDTIPCYAQSLSGIRVTPEAELLKRVLANAQSDDTVNLLWAKTFRNLRSQLPYAVQVAPIRLTAIGDAENLRAAMPETCRITLSEFDLPRGDAIRAYYCNAESGKWGKVLLFTL